MVGIEMNRRRTHIGPLAIIAWLLAAGWVALGVVTILVVHDSWAPLAATIATMAGAVTGWIAFSLRVVTGAFGVRVPGNPPITWDDVDSVEIRPGLLHIPVLITQQGRGLVEHPREGLAAGRRLAHRLAQKVSDTGELGQVLEPARRGRRGKARRAA